jgi:hypothetical protein
MKNLLIYACFLLLFTNCEPEMCCVVYDTGIDIFVENSAGANRFTPNAADPINPDSITLQYLINGVVSTFNNPQLDAPRNVRFADDQGSERIIIFPNEDENEAYPITYITWPDGDVDTLKCHFNRGDDDDTFVICDEVWFNDVLMYPDQAIVGFGRAIKIIK